LKPVFFVNFEKGWGWSSSGQGGDQQPEPIFLKCQILIEVLLMVQPIGG